MGASRRASEPSTSRRARAANAGWWWGGVKERGEHGPRTVQREIDAVAVDDERRVLAVGSCKWTASPMTIEHLQELESLAALHL